VAGTGRPLQITNGNGVSGNPSISLTGRACSAFRVLPERGRNGNHWWINGSAGHGSYWVGTANQIDGGSTAPVPSNPTISIASNPTLPGTGAVLMPGGTTAAATWRHGRAGTI
jgi:hypothetical protein